MGRMTWGALALLFCHSILSATPQDPSPGNGMGITRTVAQLMASPSLSTATKSPRRCLLPNRTKVFGGPGPGVVSMSKALKADPIGPLMPQIAGTSFAGDSALAASVTPPDPMGAVGPTQVLVCTNNRIRVFDKAGALGGLNMSTDSFFSSVIPAGTFMTDPRVRYDRNAKRWYVTAINADSSGTLVNNRILIAVSSGPSITSAASFTFFFVQQNVVAPAGDANLLADFPTLGVDVNALYIGANMFDSTGNYVNSSVWVIRKSSILGAGPIQATAFRNLVGAGGMITPQGVDNDDPTATEGYFIGVDSAAFSKLVLRRISNPGTASPSISADLNLTVPLTAYPVSLGGPNPGVEALQSNALDDGDDRLHMGQIRKIGGTSFLWTCHNIGVTNSGVASGSPDRDAIRWYKIGTLSTAPTLADSGTFFDATAGAGQSYWMPSLNVSGQGHMVLGCNYAKPTVLNGQFVGSVISGHLAGDGTGVTQPATIIDQGTSGYAPTAGGPSAGIFERWGDFSYTSVDPSDDMTMWTVQEFVVDPTHWGVRAIQIRAPQPALPQSAAPASVAAALASVSVTITGTASVPGEGWFEPGAAFPNHLAAVLSNTLTGQNIPINTITVVDATHLNLNLNTVGITPPGTFNLTITNPDGQSRVGNGLLTVDDGSGAPSCVITGPASPSNANPMNFTVTFPEVMNGLTAGDFTLGNASSPVLTGGGPTYNLAVTPTAAGPVTVALPAGRATGNGSGLPNTDSNTATVTSDTTAPTATVVASVAATNANPTFTVTFSEAVSGLTAGDFTPSSGTVTSVIGSGTVYVVTVSGAAQGTLTLTVPAASAQDAAGNGNALASGSTVFDSVAPSVTVSPPAATTKLNPIPFTITFSEPVSGLTMADITVNGGSGSLSGSGSSYTVNVVPSGPGTITVQVAAGAAVDAVGNASTVSNVGSTIYDLTPPNTSILSTPSNPSASNSATFTFSSSEVGSTFLVQIDGGAFTPNLSGTQTYNGLSAGSHTFAVAAVDPAGNVDPTPASFTWLIPFVPVDGVAPLHIPFDSSLFLANWTVSAQNSGVGWAVDATPGSFLGSAPFVSGPGSLNYNNGTNYATGVVANTGSARSPQIDRTALPGTARLKFMCNYQTDTTGTLTDTRTVTIWKGDLSGTWSAPIQLSASVTALGACSPMGTWHEHVLDLQPTWTPDLRVEFSFDTVNGSANIGAGWFIDDMEISDLVVSAIYQVVAGTTSAIPIGGTTTAGQIEFRGVVSQAAAGAVQLDVEVQPVGTPFTGTPSVSGSATGAGSPIVTTPFTIPTLGNYHVRVRTVDQSGPVTSGWMEFGLNATTAADFTLVSAPPPSGHHGGGGCGLTGFEGAFLLALLRLRRRK